MKNIQLSFQKENQQNINLVKKINSFLFVFGSWEGEKLAHIALRKNIKMKYQNMGIMPDFWIKKMEIKKILILLE